MEANGYDLLLTGNYRTAYYFTGSLTAAEAPVIFAIASNGDSLLVTSSKHAAVAGEVRELETYSIRRTIEQPWRDAAALLEQAVALFPFETPHRWVRKRNAFLNSFRDEEGRDDASPFTVLGDKLCGDPGVWNALAAFVAEHRAAFGLE